VERRRQISVLTKIKQKMNSKLEYLLFYAKNEMKRKSDNSIKNAALRRHLTPS